MRSLSPITLTGLVLVVLSPLVGLAGTIWSIYQSFDALQQNESAGIGAVGAELWSALIFTGCGLLGTAIGLFLIVFGRRRPK